MIHVPYYSTKERLKKEVLIYLCPKIPVSRSLKETIQFFLEIAIREV